MKLSIPTNWEEKLLDGLKSHNNIDNIYASMDSSLIGSARPGWLLPSINLKQMAKYIEKAKKLNISFNYLLNAPCFENLEFNGSFKKTLYKNLCKLQSTGVHLLTISNPYLLDFIKKKIPQFKIVVSVTANVNSVQKAKFFENSGADVIVLDFMINRDFKLLEEIEKNINCKLELLINEPCLYQCPYRTYHYNMIGHSSQKKSRAGGFYLDYYLVNCSYIRYSSPEELIKSPWIRPEDLKFYTDIGINNFKLAGRTHSSEVILNMVKAYSEQKYDGNLLDILSFKETTRKNEFLSGKKIISLLSTISRRKNLISYILKLNMNELKLFLRWELLSLNINKYIYIDNNKLNGFLDFFNTNQCRKNCLQCNYCKEWLQKAITINQPEVYNYLSALKEIRDAILKI